MNGGALVKYKHNVMVLFVLMICILSFGGCGQNDVSVAPSKEDTKETKEPVTDSEEDNTSAPDETETAEKEEKIRIGFAQVGHESAWRKAATECAMETFSEGNGYELTLIDADNNSEYQKESVLDFVEQKMDYIIIDPIVTQGWNKVLRAAKQEKIPVFIIDRTIDCDESMYEAWFGSDFEAEGEAAGAWLEAYLENTGREIDDINIVTVAGTKGSAAQIGRTTGFDKYVDKHANWIKLDEKDGKFTKEDGKQVMEKFISKYNDINVVVCHNDNEAWGVMEALDEAGISYGVDGDVIIISFDAVHDGLSGMLEGKLNADFECNPLSAPYVADAIRTLENGGQIDNKTNYIDEACFQAEDNVGVIEFRGKSASMITVNEKVLESRAY